MSTIVQSEIINLLSKAENIESVLQIPTYIEAVKDAIMTKNDSICGLGMWRERWITDRPKGA